MSSCRREDIESALRRVEEPALGRDLIDLKMVKAIECEGGTVRLHVELPTPAYLHKSVLEDRVRQTLAVLEGVERLELVWSWRVSPRGARGDQNRLPGVKQVIAVAAGKGGVGKSTVAVNLALALRRHGASVGLLDADVYGPSVPKMLGEAEVLPEVGERIQPARIHGLKVMSIGFFVERAGAVIWRGPMVHKLLQQFTEDVEWGELDYLVIDLPPGTGDAQLSLTQLIPLSGAVMVTTPQEVALADVVRAVGMFERVSVPVLGVIENMSYHLCPACGHRDEIFSHGGGRRLAEELAVPLLGEIPIARQVCQGGDEGKPIMVGAPDCAEGVVFMRIAAEVATKLVVLGYQGPRRSPHLVALR